MPSLYSPRSFPVLAGVAWLLLSVVGVFSFQNSEISPTPSPSPTGSPSPTPTRSPSPTPLPGAQNFHQWGSITVFNGLPSDSVRAIAQTADGVMWFGTDNGLARYDGRRVQNLSPAGSDASSSILSLAYDEKADALWIGTRAGAFIYQNDKFQPVAGTENHVITALLLWDRMYFGTDAGLILKANTVSTEPMLTEPLLASDGSTAAITGLMVYENKLLASASERGVFFINNNAISKLSPSASVPPVNAVLADGANRVFLGTDAPRGASGLSLAEGEGISRVLAPTSRVLSLGLNDGGVWAGTERFGLFQFEGTKLKKNYTFENTSGGLRSNTIYTLFTDREGVLWIGTNRGVSRFDRSGAMQQTVSDSPNSNFIRALYQEPGERGQLYAGSNRGLFVFDSEKEIWREVPAFRNKVIYALRKRYGSSIVVGGPGGLYDISGKKLLDGDIRDLAGFNTRDYAAVFGKGIFDVTNDIPKIVVSDSTITAIGERWNKLWIGTLDRGLSSYDGERISDEAGRDKLNSGNIWNVRSQLSNGSFNGPAYIAGQHGIFIFREEGNVEQIADVEDVRDIFEHDGRIWAASTTRGLLQARHDERFGWLISTIGFEQGLPSEKAFAIIPEGDKLLIATNRGVVTYKPGTIAPKIIATRFLSQRVHDLAELRSKIELDYPQNFLLVEVAGQSSRTFPEEFQYAFVLRNDKGEEIARQLSNDAQFAPKDLAAGDYTIEAIAFNRDLLPSEPLAIRFSVAKAPFPWTATALGVLLAIAIIGLVWAAFEHRRIRQRNRELAAARFDLANEAERERSRIARDLHDQTLADLRNLMMRSDKGPLGSSELRSEIESVSTEIRRICEDLSPSVLENVGLVPALEFLLSRSIDDYEFAADEDIEDRMQFPLNFQLQIYRIAQEVLANIRRHSNADRVEMKVGSADGHFLLTISDNGRAFQPDTSAGKGRGIANIRSRANLIGGRVAWKERSNDGNTFLLRIARK
jgi:signal transduction histidine kinase/ligand-binding sensor domain-containing protein